MFHVQICLNHLLKLDRCLFQTSLTFFLPAAVAFDVLAHLMYAQILKPFADVQAMFASFHASPGLVSSWLNALWNRSLFWGFDFQFKKVVGELCRRKNFLCLME